MCTISAKFGNVLTDMESEGMFVDKEHLANAEEQALEDKRIAEDYFRAWAMKKCPAAEHMNVGSGIQVRQLLFAGAPNKKRDKPGVEKTREFSMVSPEWTAWDEGGREGKAPKKGAKFELYGITKRPLRPPCTPPPVSRRCPRWSFASSRASPAPRAPLSTRGTNSPTRKRRTPRSRISVGRLFSRSAAGRRRGGVRRH